MKKLNQAIAMSLGVLAVSPALANEAALAHQWTFNDGTANDSVGTAHGTLSNGATISEGQLILDGIDDYVRTSTIDSPISTKTLMVWATLDNLIQRSGGLLTIEHASIDQFDSIVYGERIPNQWIAGSTRLQRNVPDNGGKPETELSEVFIAIVYHSDNSIEIYRNGQIYASPYTKGVLQTYNATTTDILLGVRHFHRIGEASTVDGTDAYFAGKINEARLYDTALGWDEIQAIYSAGPVIDTNPDDGFCTEPEPTTITRNLKIHIPEAIYQAPEGDMKLWVDFKYVPNQDGRLLFEVTEYGQVE